MIADIVNIEALFGLFSICLIWFLAACIVIMMEYNEDTK